MDEVVPRTRKHEDARVMDIAMAIKHANRFGCFDCL
jgi:hypothetical protein